MALTRPATPTEVRRSAHGLVPVCSHTTADVLDALDALGDLHQGGCAACEADEVFG